MDKNAAPVTSRILLNALTAALRNNPQAAVATIQRALLNQADEWAARDVDHGAFCDVDDALSALNVALEGVGATRVSQ